MHTTETFVETAKSRKQLTLNNTRHMLQLFFNGKTILHINISTIIKKPTVWNKFKSCTKKNKKRNLPNLDGKTSVLKICRYTGYIYTNSYMLSLRKKVTTVENYIIHTETHTHIHTHIYIYIYTYSTLSMKSN